MLSSTLKSMSYDMLRAILLRESDTKMDPDRKMATGCSTIWTRVTLGLADSVEGEAVVQASTAKVLLSTCSVCSADYESESSSLVARYYIAKKKV